MSLSIETSIRNSLTGAPSAITGTYAAVINADGSFTVKFSLTPAGGSVSNWRVVGDNFFPLDAANQ